MAKAMFNHVSKHLEASQKYSVSSVVFSILFSIFKSTVFPVLNTSYIMSK